MKNHPFFRFCLVFALVMIGFGCSPNKTTQSRQYATAEENNSQRTPIRIAILQDCSGSTSWSGTPTLQLHDLDPLMDLLKKHGGEIGFGLISDDSNLSLVRLSIEYPPIKPTKPSKKGNPYKVAQKTEDYKILSDKFSNEFAIWDKKTGERTTMFRNEMQRVLNTKVLAHQTDLWDAVRRLNLFISEDFTAWGKEPRSYAVLITDGQDNVGKQKANELKGCTKFLIVNASGSVGALDGLNPSRFESITSAARFIIADAERGN